MMMKIISTASVLLSPSIYAAAVPAAAQQSFPVVKPGPGLPSLASLNLTSAGLYQSLIGPYLCRPSAANNPITEKPAPLVYGPHTLATDFDPFCGGGETEAGLVDDVIACFNYLEFLGQQACVVPQGGVRFVTAGTAQVEGEPYGTSGTVSSYW